MVSAWIVKENVINLLYILTIHGFSRKLTNKGQKSLRAKIFATSGKLAQEIMIR